MLKFFNQLLSFRGGIHSEDYKILTAQLPFEKIPTPSKIVLPIATYWQTSNSISK